MELSIANLGWVAHAWMGLVGLCIGSFMNVFCHRWPIMKQIGPYSDGAELKRLTELYGKYNLSLPRSACPACNTPIRAVHNIPVLSWIILRGKCSCCKTSISLKYPAVELLFVVGFAAYGILEGFWMSGLLSLVLMPLGYGIATMYMSYKVWPRSLIVLYLIVLVLQMLMTYFGLSEYSM